MKAEERVREQAQPTGCASGLPPGRLQTRKVARPRLTLGSAVQPLRGKPSASLGQHINIGLRTELNPLFGEFDPGSG